jgi:RNA polymerase sigma-70 factor, ECF subfamily
MSSDFASLITANQQRLYAYIFSLIGKAASAWDVLQETNLVLWRKEAEFQTGTRFEAWAFTVARFQVLAYLRDQKRDPMCLMTPELLEVIAEDAEEVCERFEHRLSALRKCREQLSERSRQLVELYYERGQGLNLVSGTLKMNVNAVKQALFRVRRMLQDCIDSTPLPNKL